MTMTTRRMAASTGAHRWICAPCKRSFVSSEARAMHLYNSPRHPSCKPCKRGFVDQESKGQHVRAAHPNTYCSLCDRAFKNEQALFQHRRDAAVHFSISDSDSVGSDSDSDSPFHPAVVDHVNRSLAWESGLSYHRWVWTTEDDDDVSSAGEDSSYFNPISDDQESSNDHSADDDQPSPDTDSNTDTGTDAGTDTDTDTDASTSTEDDSDAPIPLRTDPPRSSQSPVASPSIGAPRASWTAHAASSSSDTLNTEPNPNGSPEPGIVLPEVRQTGKTGSGYTCPLCLEQDAGPALELSSIKCGHVFCTPCVLLVLR